MQIPGVLSCVVPLLLVQPPTATPPETPAMTSVKVIGVPGHAADVREVLVEEARLGRLEHVDAPWPHFRQWVAGRLVNTSTQPACNPAIDVKVLDARGRRLGDDEGRPVAVLRARDAASFSFSIPIADPSHSPPVRVE